MSLSLTPQRGSPGVNLAPVQYRDTPQMGQGGGYSAQQAGMEQARAHEQLIASIPSTGPLAQFRDFIGGMTMPQEMRRPEYTENWRAQEMSRFPMAYWLRRCEAAVGPVISGAVFHLDKPDRG